MQFTPDLASIHAHICGDGNLYIKTERRSPANVRTSRSTKPFKRYVLEYTNTNLALLENFKQLINRSSPETYVGWTKHKNRIQVRTRPLFDFFKVNGCGKSAEWWIPDEIINNPALRRGWLRAFFDDEGTIDKSKIRAYSVNKKGIVQVKKMLELEDLRVKLRDYPSPDYSTGHMYRIDIMAESYEQFKKIGFTHSKKAQKYLEYYQIRNAPAEIRTRTISLEG